MTLTLGKKIGGGFSLIILLVWLYLCGNILLLGAVAGRVIEDRRRR